MVIVYFVMWWEKRCLLGVAVEGERSRADQQQLRCRVTSERPSSPNDVVALERIAHRVHNFRYRRNSTGEEEAMGPMGGSLGPKNWLCMVQPQE